MKPYQQPTTGEVIQVSVAFSQIAYWLIMRARDNQAVATALHTIEKELERQESSALARDQEAMNRMMIHGA